MRVTELLRRRRRSNRWSIDIEGSFSRGPRKEEKKRYKGLENSNTHLHHSVKSYLDFGEKKFLSHPTHLSSSQ